MPSVKDYVGSSTFQGWAPQKRRQFLEQKYPTFPGLSTEAQQRVISYGQTPMPEIDTDPNTIVNMVGNIPGDAFETVSNMVYPLRHPVEFSKGIKSIMTDPVVRAKVVEGLKETHGSFENFGRYSEEHPVQFGLDVTTILGGLGLLANVPAKLGATGKAARIASEAGKAATKTARVLDPQAKIGQAVSGVRKVVGSEKLGIPEKLTAASMKIPLTALRAEERAKVFKAIVRDEKLSLSPKSFDKMRSDIKVIDEGISAKLDELSDLGTEVDIADVVTALDDLKKDFKYRRVPKSYFDALDEVKDSYIKHILVKGGPEGALNLPGGGKIKIADAHNMKKGAYREIGEFYKRGQQPLASKAGIKDPIESVAVAEAARALRASILDHPDVPKSIKKDLAREASLANASKWVERAIARGENLDVVTLSGMMFGVLVEKGVPGTLAYHMMRKHQSQLGLLLAHGSSKMRKAGAKVRPGTLGAFQAGRLVQEANSEQSGGYSGPMPYGTMR